MCKIYLKCHYEGKTVPVPAKWGLWLYAYLLCYGELQGHLKSVSIKLQERTAVRARDISHKSALRMKSKFVFNYNFSSGCQFQGCACVRTQGTHPLLCWDSQKAAARLDTGLALDNRAAGMGVTEPPLLDGWVTARGVTWEEILDSCRDSPQQLLLCLTV